MAVANPSRRSATAGKPSYNTKSINIYIYYIDKGTKRTMAMANPSWRSATAGKPSYNTKSKNIYLQLDKGIKRRGSS